MAIFHLSIKTVARASGRSSVAAAAYRSGERLLNDRDGRAHDFRARSGVTARFIAAPDSAPAWALDRQSLWNAAEAAEPRLNAVTAREFEAAFPAELDAVQREALARQFASDLVKRFGFAVDCSIHAPSAEGDQRNHHLHALATTRAIGPDGLGAKTRALDDRKSGAVDAVRELWAELSNRALEVAQSTERVDHRSHAAQRAEAQEAAQAQERAERSLNPIGKRDRVHEATERATEARERVQGLPEAPGVHKGPTVTAQERREALEAAVRERERQEANAARESDALRAAAERDPPRMVSVSERLLGEAERALDRIRQVGVRVFVMEQLTEVTKFASRFMDRLVDLGLARRSLYEDPIRDRSARDTVGRGVAVAAHGSPEVTASVAWAAVAAEQDQRDMGHWADDLSEGMREHVHAVEEMLTTEELDRLRTGSALDAFARFDVSPEFKLDAAEAYLQAEQEAGRDRSAALRVVGKDREIMALDREGRAEGDFSMQRQKLLGKERDDGWEL